MIPIQIFISYSHKDEALKIELENHLKILKRNGLISVWHDRKITAGDKFENVIDENLKKSQIIILLVSSDFIASDYCYEIEMKEALKLSESGNAIVVPIILRDCSWHQSLFGRLEALPTDGKAITGKEWHSQDEAFKNAELGIEKIIHHLNISSDENLNRNVNNTDGNKTLIQAVELFIQENSKINYNSSKQDFEDILKLKTEIYNQLIGDFDKKVENTPRLREKIPQILFDNIYTSEKLETSTIIDIQKIRDEKSDYKWHDRKVIINAITLSILCAKTFDPKKANLLIDFISDLEDGVWECALTGLVLSLVHHQNKWLRFDDLKRRLNSLRSIEEVQHGLYNIETILRLKLFTNNPFDRKIFDLPFFNSPIQCFLPFYENNLFLTDSIASNSTDVDSEEFSEMVNKLPFLDSMKYAMCIAMKEGTLKENKSHKGVGHLMNQLNISSIFEPYQNLISEYFVFLHFYPKSRIENIFDGRLTIAHTKLKDFILNKVNELLTTADMFMQSKDYGTAVNKLEDVLKIEPENWIANYNIAECYIKQKKADYNSAIFYLKKIENVQSNNIDILIKISDTYILWGKFNYSLEYATKIKEIEPNNKDAFINETHCLIEIGEIDKGLEVSLIAHAIYPLEYLFTANIGACYAVLEQHDESLVWRLKAEKLCLRDKTNSYRAICQAYTEVFDFAIAIEYGNLALTLSPKNPDVLMTIGRAFLLGKTDLSMARKYLEKSLSISTTPIGYGNIGHLELLSGDLRKAIFNYIKCLEMLDNGDEFIKKMEMDQKFILKYFSESEYVDIVNKVINNWKTSCIVT